MTHTRKSADGPLDVYITVDGDRRGFVLQDTPEGLIPHAPQFLDEMVPEQATDAFSYKHVPSSVLQVVEMADWSLGAGFVDAPPSSVAFGGYSYSRGVDASAGSRVYRSPLAVTDTGVTVQITRYYRAPSYGWYGISGRYLFKWDVTGDSWSQVYDSGSAAIPVTDIVEFTNSVDTYVLLAFGEAQVITYGTDGTSFSSTVTSKYAKFFAVRGVSSAEPQLWKIRGNGRISVSTLAISGWSAEDPITPGGDTVNAMVVSGAHLWVFYASGYRGYDGVTIADMVEVGYLTDANNGKAATVSPDGTVFFNLSNRLVALDPYNFTTATVWEAAHPELNGSIGGIAFSSDTCYFALNNAAGDVYLMKGTFAGPFHTWAYKATDTCTALAVAGSGLFHETNPAVMAGLSAAPVHYVLPREGYRPEDDANVKFETGEGTLYGAWLDKGAMTFPAWLNQGRLITERTVGSRRATLGYGLDGSTTDTDLVVAYGNGLTEGDVSGEVTFTRIRHVLTLEVTDSEHSPVVVAATFNVTPNPPRYLFWTLPLHIGGGKLRGGGDWGSEPSYASSLAFLQGAAGKRGTFEDWFGGTYTVKFLNTASQGFRRKAVGKDRRAVEGVIVLSLVEITEIETDGNVFVWAESAYAGSDVWGE